MTPEIDAPKDSKDVTPNDHGGSGTPRPESIPAGGEEHNPEAARKSAKPNKENKHWLEYVTAAFALVAALGSASAVIVGYWQWSAMTESNAISRQAFTIVQRAFVFIAGFDAVPVRIRGELIGWAIWPKIANEGNTQALSMRYFSSAPIEFLNAVNQPSAPMPEDPDIIFEQLRANPVTSKVSLRFIVSEDFQPTPMTENISSTSLRSFVGAKAKSHIWPVIIRPIDLEGVFNRSLRMQISGTFRYRDVFEDTPEHTTKFCMEITARKSETGEITPIEGGACFHWNCTDNECKRDREEYDAEARETPRAKPK
jgi:hypothetical protein